MKKLLFVVIVLAVGFAGGVYWSRHSGTAFAHPDTGSGSGVSYSSVTLHSGEAGWFDGTVQVSNHTSVNTTVYVTVHVYDGEQNVGDLLGHVTLKPESSSQVDLMSTDEYQPFTDTTVELLPIG